MTDDAREEFLRAAVLAGIASGKSAAASLALAAKLARLLDAGDAPAQPRPWWRLGK